jgi:hypothetical protein
MFTDEQYSELKNACAQNSAYKTPTDAIGNFGVLPRGKAKTGCEPRSRPSKGYSVSEVRREGPSMTQDKSFEATPYIIPPAPASCEYRGPRWEKQVSLVNRRYPLFSSS